MQRVNVSNESRYNLKTLKALDASKSKKTVTFRRIH